MDEIEIEVNPGTQFQLPSYVAKLSSEEMQDACSSEEKEYRIIAAGTDPKDGKITILTATGKVMIFDARKYHIPEGPSQPSCSGSKLHLPNTNDRWYGMEDGCYVDSRWVLSNSTSGLVGAVISTNTYSNEDKP